MTVWKRARKKPVVVEFREVEPNIDVDIEEIKTEGGYTYARPNMHYIIRHEDGRIEKIMKEFFKKTYEVL